MLICRALVCMAKQLACKMDVSGIVDAAGCRRDTPEIMQGEASAELLLHQVFYPNVHLITSKTYTFERGEQIEMIICSWKMGPDVFEISVEIDSQIFMDLEQ